MSHACQRHWNCYKTFTLCSFLGKVQNPLRLPLRTCAVLNIFTSTCASRHKGVQILNISTAKHNLELKHFVHFDLECASRHITVHFFHRLNFQKWSETISSFLICLLAHVLRRCAFFEISIFKNARKLRCFVHVNLDMFLLFDPQEPQIIGQTQFRDFSTFLRPCIFFLLALSSESFSSLIFFLLSSSFFLLPSSFFLFSSFFFSAFLFSSLILSFFSPLPFSSLLFSSRLVSSLLFSSLL